MQKTAAKKAPATKAPAKKAPATKAPAKKATVKKATATKATAKKAACRHEGSGHQEGRDEGSGQEGTGEEGCLGGRSWSCCEVEDPWTKQELAQVRKQLNDDVARLTSELSEVEGDLAGMIENSGEGAGHDQADVGSASFERDQEMVIVNNARDMLVQSQHALERIADGSYGQCEICGNPIGKNRLMAFPRATLCLSCKQREERR